MDQPPKPSISQTATPAQPAAQPKKTESVILPPLKRQRLNDGSKTTSNSTSASASPAPASSTTTSISVPRKHTASALQPSAKKSSATSPGKNAGPKDHGEEDTHALVKKILSPYREEKCRIHINEHKVECMDCDRIIPIPEYKEHLESLLHKSHKGTRQRKEREEKETMEVDLTGDDDDTIHVQARPKLPAKAGKKYKLDEMVGQIIDLGKKERSAGKPVTTPTARPNIKAPFPSINQPKPSTTTPKGAKNSVEWLEHGLDSLRREYPDARFERVPGLNGDGKHQVKCHDCPLKLYIVTNVQNFAAHLNSQSHVRNVQRREAEEARDTVTDQTTNQQANAQTASVNPSSPAPSSPTKPTKIEQLDPELSKSSTDATTSAPTPPLLKKIIPSSHQPVLDLPIHQRSPERTETKEQYSELLKQNQEQAEKIKVLETRLGTLEKGNLIRDDMLISLIATLQRDREQEDGDLEIFEDLEETEEEDWDDQMDLGTSP